MAREKLPGDITRILVAQPKKTFKYKAGQYVEIILDDGTTRPYSIANAYDPKVIEFYIRHAKEIITQDTVSFIGPFGKMKYQKRPKRPLLFLAAGTGFTPCKAIIEEALKDKDYPEMFFCWITRSSREAIYKKLLKNHPDLSHYHIYASGPKELVFEAQKKLGHPKYFYSDWLDYIASPVIQL